MRSRTAYVEFADVTIRSEEQNEELQLTTYRETAAAILLALAESGLEHDPSDEVFWSCEIELLDEYCDDVDAGVPYVPASRKH